MKKITAAPWFAFLIAAILGVLLHFLYGWLPNPVTAIFSPVRESIWEHLKILYFPLLLFALILGRGNRAVRTARLLAIPVVGLLMLVLAWWYHILFQGDNMVFDRVLYIILMLLGFLLPRLFWRAGNHPGIARLATVLVLLLGLLILWFTFSPPANVLFADLREEVRTFLTIPT